MCITWTYMYSHVLILSLFSFHSLSLSFSCTHTHTHTHTHTQHYMYQESQEAHEQPEAEEFCPYPADIGPKVNLSWPHCLASYLRYLPISLSVCLSVHACMPCAQLTTADFSVCALALVQECAVFGELMLLDVWYWTVLLYMYVASVLCACMDALIMSKSMCS